MNLLFLIYAAIAAAQYVPEPYGWACYSLLSKRSWTECANVSKSEVKSCLCGIPEFVSLTESCLIHAVRNATDPEAAAEFARSQSLCKIRKSPPPSDDTTVSSSKSNVAYTNSEDQFIGLLSSNEIAVAVATGEWRMMNDRISERAGAALCGFWGVLVIIKYLTHILQAWLPQNVMVTLITLKPVKCIRAKLLNPPLGRIHHSQPLKGVCGIRLPTRAFSLIITIFLVLNYCLIFTHYPYEANNFMFPTARQQWSKCLAIRASFMAMWKLPLLFCFAGRNTVFLLLGHPWSMETFNELHQWIARITVADIIIHCIAISVVKADQGVYGYIWNVPYWRWGVVGALAGSILIVQSYAWLARKNYEVFKLGHIVLAIVFVIASWYHVKALPYGTKHMYAVISIWGFDHMTRLIRIIMAKNSQATIEHSNSMSIIRISSPGINAWAMRRGAKYMFLHISPWYKFWQSHPFTLVRDWKSSSNEKRTQDSSTTLITSNKSTDTSISAVKSSIKTADTYIDSFSDNNLVVAVQHRSGITKHIANLPEGKVKVALDGPYGMNYPLARFRKVIFVAGGVGITAHLSYMQLLLSKTHADPIQLKLYWAVRDLHSVEWLMDAIAILSFQVDVVIFTTQHVNFGQWRKYPIRIRNIRLDCDAIVKKEIEETDMCDYHCTTAIFSCGPGSLNDDARMAACWAIENATQYVDYYEESFSS